MFIKEQLEFSNIKDIQKLNILNFNKYILVRILKIKKILNIEMFFVKF